MGRTWLQVPKDMLASAGEIGQFAVRQWSELLQGRVFKYFGESLRQAGILVFGSALIIWALMFVIGAECGIEGAYFNRQTGTPPYAGVFTAWCDLRELTPYAFGYMLAAKVGTGLVAEIGAMKITDEVDALEVIGVSSMTYLCGTRLLAGLMVLPFMYLVGIGVCYLGSFIAVVKQVGEVSSGGYFLIFWMFQNPPDVLFSFIKAFLMLVSVVVVGCYYGYNAGGGPVGVGTATAKSMVLNLILIHFIGMMGTQLFWGSNPRAPIGG